MTPTIYTYDSLWGHYNSQEVGIVRSGAGRYLCRWIVIIVTNKNLLSQMKCVEARGRETPGFFVLSCHFGEVHQQGNFGRGASAGVHQQEASAGGGFSRGASAGGLRQGGFSRGASAEGLQQGGGSEKGALRMGASAGGLQLFQNIMSFL